MGLEIGIIYLKNDHSSTPILWVIPNLNHPKMGFKHIFHCGIALIFEGRHEKQAVEAQWISSASQAGSLLRSWKTRWPDVLSEKHRQEQCIPGRDEKLKYKNRECLSRLVAPVTSL